MTLTFPRTAYSNAFRFYMLISPFFTLMLVTQPIITTLACLQSTMGILCSIVKTVVADVAGKTRLSPWLQMGFSDRSGTVGILWNGTRIIPSIFAPIN